MNFKIFCIKILFAAIYNKKAAGSTKTMEDKDKLELLWSEYQYRHEHCWKVVFQLTTAATILGVIPYSQSEAARVLDWRIVILPVLSSILVLFGFLIMWSELRLLDKVRERYRELQKGLGITHHERSTFDFDYRVYAYLAVFLVLTFINLAVVVSVWLPHLRSLPKQ